MCVAAHNPSAVLWPLDVSCALRSHSHVQGASGFEHDAFELCSRGFEDQKRRSVGFGCQFEPQKNRVRQNVKRKITAIMAADIAEYTRIIAEDEEEGLARLESYRRVFDDFVARSGGRVFNSGGDSVMCEFPSAVEATRCAIDIQESLRTRNLSFPADRQMHFRIGITIGDVVERDGDLLGDGVNVAARLQSLAVPGSICVARNVQEAVANKIALPFRDLGHREVKNLPHPVHAFQIEMGMQRPKSTQLQKRRTGEALLYSLGHSKALWFVAGLAIAASGAGLYWMGRSGQMESRPIAVTILQPTPPHDPLPQQAPQPQQTIPPLPKASESIVVTETLTPAEAFDKLAKAGGLVKDAASAPELYHNARVFEARGESANARRDYLAFAALGTDHIDPLMRLAALIRTQDGRAGAREVFSELAKGRSRAASLVHILQFDGAARTARLVEFASAHPEFSPVHAMLALDLGEDRQNAQTIDEKRRELAANSRFVNAERDGMLVPFFLDQSVLAQWLDHAHKRENTLRAFFTEGQDRISAQFTRTNAGWISAISLPEPATQLEYRVGANDEFRSTGVLQLLDPRTGKPMPNPSFNLGSQQGATEIALRYLDPKGVSSLVTMIAFDPGTALVRGLRETLEQTSTSWLSFGSGQNSQNLYLTHLISYRCAIEKVEIGFNGEPPKEEVILPPCDSESPYRVTNAMRSTIALKPDTKSATIRITYVGGERSDIKTFARSK